MPPDTILIECELPESCERVWRALTEASLLAAWLMPNDLRPIVGWRFRFLPGEELPPIDCEVLAAVPHRLLRWRQSEPVGAQSDAAEMDARVDSVVSIELAALPGGGTHLRVEHGAFEYRRGEARCCLRRAA